MLTLLKLLLVFALVLSPTFLRAADDLAPDAGGHSQLSKPDLSEPKQGSEKLQPQLDFDAAAKCVVFKPIPDSIANNQNAMAFVERIKSLPKDTLLHIHRVTGLYLPQGKEIHVYFEANAPQGSGPSPLYAVTTMRGKAGAQIRVFVAPTVRDRRDPRKIFQHEMIHAVQMCWMYGGHYWRQPLWFMEGLGTFVGEDDIGLVASSRGKPSRVRGLDGPARPPYIYMEGCLAFEFIKKTWGEDTLKKILYDVTVTHIPVPTVLKNYTGLEWREFIANARKFAVAYLTPSAEPKPPPTVSKPPEPLPAAAPIQRAATAPAQRAPIPTELGLVLQETGNALGIVAVSEESAAAAAGLEAGDVVLSVNGRPVRSVSDFQSLLNATQPGVVVTLQILRNGKSITAKLKVGAAR